MAEAKKKRVLKKTETVRERVERKGNEQPKKRHIRVAASRTGRPLRALGRIIAKLTRPFAFLLIPFKTRPARFIGRIFAAILLFRFFRDSWTEVRQVNWPTAYETYRMTMAVFIFSLLFGVLVAITDFGLDKAFKKLFID